MGLTHLRSQIIRGQRQFADATTTTSHESARRGRKKEKEREKERSRAHNDSERIVTLPLVVRETGAIMRDSPQLAIALFAYETPSEFPEIKCHPREADSHKNYENRPFNL